MNELHMRGELGMKKEVNKEWKERGTRNERGSDLGMNGEMNEKSIRGEYEIKGETHKE